MPHKQLAEGVIVPMITPFTEKGTIDVPAAGCLTQHVIAGGAEPFVLGTTGESASIPTDERFRLVESVVQATAGKACVYAGISSNALEESYRYGKDYFDLGVDAVVAHLPAYYQLSADGMLGYFTELADRLPGPLILYNITAVTHQSLPLEVIDRLSRHPRIIAVKDSERDHARFARALELWSKRDDFGFLAGWGAVMAEFLMKGARGIVPSTGNIVPGLYSELYHAAVSGDREAAEALQARIAEISRVYQDGLNLGESLAALKVILHELNLCRPYMLPPLYRLGIEREMDILKKFKNLD